MPISTEGRLELLGLREIAAAMNLSYADVVWQRREAENPREAKSTGAWPYRPASSLPSNVTPISKGSRK